MSVVGFWNRQWLKRFAGAILLSTALLTGFLSERALAYVLVSYRYTPPINDSQFSVLRLLSTHQYLEDTVWEAVGDWNAAVNVDTANGLTEDVAFSYVMYDNTTTDHVFLIDSYPYQWCGYTDFLDASWVEHEDSNGWPSQNWAKNKLRLNVATTSTSDPNLNSCRSWEGTAAHEMGHGLGLDHSNVTQSLMSTGAQRYNTPQADDVNAVRAKY